MSKPGHNSKVQAGPIAGERLKSFVERIERLEEERKAIGGDIRDIYAEAKGVGYDVKTMRWVVQERRMDYAARAERDALRDVYQHALDTAVGLVRGGMSLREAGRITGASKSSIHRALAVPAMSQTAGPKPEDGDDGITESCGGAESRSADDGGSPARDAGEGLKRPSEVYPSDGSPSKPTDDLAAGVAPGPHDTVQPYDSTVQLANEAPATPSVGAVGPEARVAPQTDLEMPPIPSHLRSRTAQGRGV